MNYGLQNKCTCDETCVEEQAHTVLDMEKENMVAIEDIEAMVRALDACLFGANVAEGRGVDEEKCKLTSYANMVEKQRDRLVWIRTRLGGILERFGV